MEFVQDHTVVKPWNLCSNLLHKFGIGPGLRKGAHIAQIPRGKSLHVRELPPEIGREPLDHLRPPSPPPAASAKYPARSPSRAGPALGSPRGPPAPVLHGSAPSAQRERRDSRRGAYQQRSYPMSRRFSPFGSADPATSSPKSTLLTIIQFKSGTFSLIYVSPRSFIAFRSSTAEQNHHRHSPAVCRAGGCLSCIADINAADCGCTGEEATPAGTLR